MDAFHAAVAGGRWGYCPCPHCRPTGAARVLARRRGRARLRAADRDEIAKGLAEAAERRHLAHRAIATARDRVARIRAALADAEAALVVARGRAAVFLAGGEPGCPCGDPDCDGTA